MFGWFVFYILSFSLLITNKKVITFVYPIFFWIFVGFRDNIGTDYPFNLNAITRSYIPFKDFITESDTYSWFDLELLNKFVAMLLYELNLKVKYYYVFVAGIEALIICYILRKCNNTKLFLLYFICFFTISLPMNATRQGLCFLFAVLAFFFESRNKIPQRYISYLLGALSHYASTGVTAFMCFKTKNIKSLIVLIVLVLFLYHYIDLDAMSSRYDSALTAYKIQGLGLRIYLYCFLVVYPARKVLKWDYFTYENVLLYILMIGVFVSGPFIRLYNFYNHLMAFYILAYADRKQVINKNIMLLFPFAALFFELFEIIRTPYIPTAGVWFPYANWLFD